MMGGKCLCVVVKYLANDAFVVTAYLTDKPKAGEDVWPTKNLTVSLSSFRTCAQKINLSRFFRLKAEQVIELGYEVRFPKEQMIAGLE